MKNIRRILFLILISLVCSCTNEFDEISNVTAKDPMKVTAVLPDWDLGDEKTRTSITTGTYPTAPSPVWVTGDSIGIYPNAGGDQLSFRINEGGSKTCSFDGGGWAMTSASYTAYSPFKRSYYYKQKNALPISMIGQIQNGNDNSDHLGAYDIQIATGEKPESGSLTFAFSRKVALVRIEITAPKAATWSSVSLESDALFTTDAIMNLDLETPTVTPITTSNSVTLNLENVSTTRNNLSIIAYMMLLPVDLTGKTLSVKLTDIEGNIYSKEASITNNKTNFAANAARWVTADFEDIIPNNQIWYTSSDGNIIAPYKTGDFGANIISNVYENGKGIITFDGDITSIANQAFSYCNTLTSISIPKSIATIGYSAFLKCDKLSQITIGNNVTTIDTGAFESCSNLADLTIPNSVTSIGIGAFRFCSNLTDLTIPNSVTSIGASAFWGCSSLASITLSDNITKIEDYLFYQCSGLKAVVLPKGVASIGTESFRYCNSLSKITIHNNVITLGDNAFVDCDNLTEVYCMALMPPSGGYAFDRNTYDYAIYVYSECLDAYKSAWSNYADIIYPNGYYADDTSTHIYYTTYDGQPISSDKLAIKSNTYSNGQGEMVVYGELKLIPDQAFYNCDKLISIKIPNSVTMIGKRAFADCGSLLSVNIGNGVTTISDHSFEDCINLTSITLPDNVTTIGSYAFHGCENLEFVSLGNAITTIGFYVFEGCDRLEEFKGEFVSDDGRCIVIDGILHSFAPYDITEYTIPDNITDIQWYAFRNISGLTTITIPDNVTYIGNDAFYGCSNLTTVTISDKIEYIADYAFYCCNKLKNVYCMATEPPHLGNKAFYNNAYGRKIYVPYESVDKYKDSYANNGWNDYEYYSAITGYQF